MESHEVLKQAMAEPVGVKQLAAELSLSPSLLYKWCEPSAGPGAPGTENPLDRVEQICRRTGETGPVQWLCARFGGFFVENPKVDGRAPQALLPVTRRIRAEWENLKRVAEQFVTACERNEYAGS